MQKGQDKVIIDEEIKEILAACESKLADLRTVFKEYQNRNKLKLPETVIKARTRNIDILRHQINLLKERFKVQNERSRMENALNPNSTQSMIKKKRKKGVEKEFIDLFSINSAGDKADKVSGSINGGGGDDESEEDERDLNDDEKKIMEEFADNDKELEALTLQIVAELKDVKNNALNIEANVDE